MERRGASSVFPIAVRARLSTEDSTSDASSSSVDSDDNSGIDVADGEESYVAAQDDAVSLIRRPSMPKARITRDEEDDDILEEVVFEDNDGDVEDLKLEEEDLEVGSSFEGDYEGFDGGLVSGRDEDGFFNGSDEIDDNLGDEGFLNTSLELQLRAKENGYFGKVETMPPLDDSLANGGGLDMKKEAKLEKDGSDVVKLEVEKNLAPISSVYDKIGAFSSGDVEQSDDDFSLELKDLAVVSSNIDTKKDNIAGDIEGFGGKLVSGREEDGLTIECKENNDNLDDEDLIALLKDFQVHVKDKGFFEKMKSLHAFDDALGNDENLELNEMMLEMDDGEVVEDDLNSIAAVYDKIDVVSSEDVELINDFSLELKDLVVEFSNMDSEENNLADNIQTTQKSVIEVELSTPGNEAQACNFGIPEVEDNSEEIVKIGAVGISTPGQYWNEEMQSKADEDECSVWKVLQVEATQAEADFPELKGFEVNNAVDFIERQILELVSLPDCKAFEQISAEIYTDIMETKKDSYLYANTCSVDSQKAKDSSSQLLSLTGYDNAYESSYPIKEICIENAVAYPAKLLDNFEGKHEESRAIVTQVSVTNDHNACEHSSDMFSSYYASENEMESRLDSFHAAYDEGLGEEDEPVISEWPARGATLENSEVLKHILEKMEESSSSSHLGFESSKNYSHIVDGQIISDSEEEVEVEEEGSAKELFDTPALATLLRASSGGSCGVSDPISKDSLSIFSVKHPTGFRSTTSFLRHRNTPLSAHIMASSNPKIAGEYGNSLDDKQKMLHMRIDQIRLKYLHLLQRLGHFADDSFPDHVLYRLGLVGGVSMGSKISEEFCLEEKFKDDFAFSCNILVLGKTGAGKSAAINSIFGEKRASTDPFQPSTNSVKEISGMVDGVYITVIDTPGLLTSLNDGGVNRKILSSVKKYTGKTLDVVLYVDRLDTHTRDSDDMHILRMITRILGSSIWHNTIIVLTHAASASPDGPDGSPLSYEAIVAQRSHTVQQSIRQATGDVHHFNPVALMENHHSCSKNMDGESLLPNGLRWRAWLLLLCYSTKILSEFNSILKHSRNQGYDNYNFDNVSYNMTNEAYEDDDEFDQLPSFKPLRRSDIQKLTNEQKVNPFDSDNPTSCYQFRDPKPQLLTRPDMYIHYWDHDSGYDGTIIEENIDIACLFPISLPVEITIDKKELGIYLGSSILFKHGIQPVGKQMVQGETNLSNLKKNKAAAGILFTFLGETLLNESKLEDMVPIESEVAFGASMEFHLKKKHSSRKRRSTFHLSVIKWKDIFEGANLLFEFSTRQNSRISVCVGINNPNSGQISIRTNTRKQVHVSLLGLFTIMLSIRRIIWTKGTS